MLKRINFKIWRWPLNSAWKVLFDWSIEDAIIFRLLNSAIKDFEWPKWLKWPVRHPASINGDNDEKPSQNVDKILKMEFADFFLGLFAIFLSIPDSPSTTLSGRLMHYYRLKNYKNTADPPLTLWYNEKSSCEEKRRYILVVGGPENNSTSADLQNQFLKVSTALLEVFDVCYSVLFFHFWWFQWEFLKLTGPTERNFWNFFQNFSFIPFSRMEVFGWKNVILTLLKL